MELLNQLDGFEQLGQVKMVMATNRPDILDPALLRPGRLDRKIEIPLPNEAARRRRPTTVLTLENSPKLGVLTTVWVEKTGVWARGRSSACALEWKAKRDLFEYVSQLSIVRIARAGTS